MLWCDFPKDAHLPEMWKGRPVIVIATDRSLGGAVTVVPCSSQDQTGNKWAVRLDTPIDGKGPSWAICDKPYFLLPETDILQDTVRYNRTIPS